METTVSTDMIIKYIWYLDFLTIFIKTSGTKNVRLKMFKKNTCCEILKHCSSKIYK